MARCGCGGGSCNCSIRAGDNVRIEGSGSIANPYIIHATVNCDEVRSCISPGDGITYDPTTGTISVDLSDQAGNTVTIGPDGGLYAAVDCADVRPCISAGPGAVYDPATGIVGAGLSTEAGNNIAIGPDGGLFVPTGAATVTTGCGLTGDGSGGAPVAVQTATWPYACDVDANAGNVYCDSAGQLRGEPRGVATFMQEQVNQSYPPTPVPSGLDNVITSRSLLIANPDACREAFVIVEGELDVDFDLPANSGAAMGIMTDEMQYFANRGTTIITSTHCQVTKVVNAVVPAGGTLNFGIDVTMGRAFGGATYNRIQTWLRAFIFVL